jgi:3-isopropylmalate/(R)-2-methylmalate dehydratase small subunit
MMEKFTVLRGKTVPMMRTNINTDDIIAAQAMMGKVERIGDRLFTGARYDSDGNERPEFILNQDRYRGSRILVAGANFGCGSSREAAVWALTGYGIRCVIAPSYGEIFHDNSYQNGLLPIILDEATVARIAAAIEGADEPVVTVDLERGEIRLPENGLVRFSIPEERRAALLAGMDELDILLTRGEALNSFQIRDRSERPWIWSA